MRISFSLPETQFVTESPEEATRKIRMFAAFYGDDLLNHVLKLAGE
jgi:hypothetical protein